MFTQTNLLEKAMDAAWLRNEVIAGNIANIDTPGYKKRTVEFESILRNAVQSKPSLHTINTQAIVPKITMHNDNFSIRADENNVDIDVEMAEISKNYIQYDTIKSMISSNFKRLSTVINNIK